RGLRISGVNGGIKISVREGVNADFLARGMNGGVRSEIPGVEVQKEEYSKYSARIGSGGSPISLSGINGGVRLTRAAV
ncbi:MAG TPA: hypothetical protein VF507_06875, partial [Pyrinomonadaceae bacterium]